MKVEDGKIIVPVEGIYMVYSQVKIVYKGHDHKTIHYGHYTLRGYPARSRKSSLKILHSVNTASHNSKETYSSHHQSGLFYIPRGGNIYTSLSLSSKLSYKNIEFDAESTYLGAYFVSGCRQNGCPEVNNNFFSI